MALFYLSVVLALLGTNSCRTSRGSGNTDRELAQSNLILLSKEKRSTRQVSSHMLSPSPLEFYLEKSQAPYKIIMSLDYTPNVGLSKLALRTCLLPRNPDFKIGNAYCVSPPEPGENVHSTNFLAQLKSAKSFPVYAHHVTQACSVHESSRDIPASEELPFSNQCENLYLDLFWFSPELSYTVSPKK